MKIEDCIDVLDTHFSGRIASEWPISTDAWLEVKAKLKEQARITDVLKGCDCPVEFHVVDRDCGEKIPKAKAEDTPPYVYQAEGPWTTLTFDIARDKPKKRKKSKWHDCKEIWPERVGHQVIGLTEFGNMAIVSLNVHGEWRQQGKDTILNIVKWRELPKPPKDEE